MKLLSFELHKIWTKRQFLCIAFVLLAVNLFFLWHETDASGGIPAAAYKQMTEKLSGKTMAEKQKILSEKYEKVSAMVVIEKIALQESYGKSSYTEALRAENRAVMEKYGSVYEAGKGLVYTESVLGENVFISDIKQEFEKVSGYPDFIKNIHSRAETYAGISIFKSENGSAYNELCLKKEDEVYTRLESVTVDYVPQKGLVTALGFRFTDVILMAFIVLVAMVCIRDEKDGGLLGLIQTAPRGKIHTALAKAGAIAASPGILVTACYGMNLLYCAWRVGLGDMGRAVQSVPDLMSCPLKISAGGYVLLFVAVKSMAVMIMGLLTALVSALARKPVTGFLAAGAFLAASQAVYMWMDAVSAAGIIKYMNLAALLDTNDLIGRYQAVRFFQLPVSKTAVEFVTAAVLGILFLVLFLVKFCSAAKLSDRPVFLFKKQRRAGHIKKRGLMAFEGYKLARMNGCLLMAAVYLVFTLWQAAADKVYISTPEMYYREYMQSLQGQFTEEKYAYIRQMNETFAPVRQLEASLAVGEITQEQYQSLMGNYGQMSVEITVFDEVVRRCTAYLEEHEDAWIVYDTGYGRLFDFENKTDIYEMLWLLAFVIVCSSGIFSMEKMTGMVSVVTVTPLGCVKTAKAKLKAVTWMTAVLTGISMITPAVQAAGYGIGAFFAPAQSLSRFDYMHPWISIASMIVLQYGARFLCGMTAALAVCLISWLSGKYVTGIFGGFLLFCFLPLLAVCGIQNAAWFSVYPLFHMAGMLAEKACRVIVWCYLAAFLLLSVAVYQYLKHVFGRN